jgi:hypothetical protein
MKRAQSAIDLVAPKQLKCNVNPRNLFVAALALREWFEVLALHAVQFFGTQ